jgi:WD40 repeat protein/mono/diheme cytochrome c family protein
MMRISMWSLAIGLAVLAAPGTARAQGASFSKDVAPIFKAKCAQCHGSRQPQGGLSLSTFAALQKGGKGGKELGMKAADSRLFKFLDGSLQPKMPIGGSLTKDELAKIKSWLDAGAKPDVDVNQVVVPDAAIGKVDVPAIPLKVPVLPQVAALAWSSDGKILAIGTYKVVRLVNPETGETIRELKDHSDVVHSLQFSRDGKLLAAAGGPPAQQGEIKIWEVATGNLVRTITGHNDFIYSVSWNNDDTLLASGSYDKLIKIWDVKTGSEVKTLKDHADAVYAVAFSPDGKLLASGSADRSVKMWEVASGKRIYTLAGHGDIVLSLAFNKAGSQVTSCGADKTVRVWNVNATAGQQARNMSPHQKTVNEVAYSPDGTLMATASDDHSTLVMNAGNGSQVAAIKDQPEALLSAAISPDNKLVAVGSFDGSVKLFNVADGKLAKTIIDLPKPPEPKAGEKKPADPKAAPAAKPGDKPAVKKAEAKK